MYIIPIPAGPAWVKLFPTSTSLDDLVEPFQSGCRAFIASLEASGAAVIISATYRPPERAYLMHYCSMIADNGQAPDSVPPMAGVDIEWNLGTPQATIAACKAMMAAYGIAYPAALVSRHTQRLAIDMTIIDPPAQGNALYALGAPFGVIKLPLSVLNDPPHWSNDGH